MLLDTWERSGSSAEEFGERVDVTSTTLCEWRPRFSQDDPLGRVDRPRLPLPIKDGRKRKEILTEFG